MQIIEWNEFLKHGLDKCGECAKRPVSMTVGVFDGVHRGHRALIERIVSHNATVAVPVVVTFRSVSHKDEKDSLQTFEERAEVLEKLGVEVLIVVDFTESFSRMAGREFLETLFTHANIGFFATGANFRCGCGLDTDAAAIRDFFAARGVPVEIVAEVLHDGLPVSSSRIRAALAEGDTGLAEALIGIPAQINTD